MTRSRSTPRRSGPLRWLWLVVRTVVLAVVGYLLACTLLLVAYRWVSPPATTVQIQRMVEAAIDTRPYTLRYQPVDQDEQDPDIRHAVVATEDARFYTHRGFDWKEIQAARATSERTGRPMRGASTITQQTVKNLFLTTNRSWVRKGLEVPLTFLAELILPKDRILTLYLNVAEWGVGVFGIEAAAEYYYTTDADRLSRDQAARLTALLPAPLTRSPQSMGRTAARIQTRMRQMGW